MRIVLKEEGLLELAFAPQGKVLAAVRALPSRRFDPASCTWFVPHTQENWAAMSAQPAMFPLAGIPAPKGTGYSVEGERGLLKIRTPWSASNAEALRRLPDYRTWDKEKQSWFAKPTRHNLQHLRAALPQAIWDAKAETWYQEMVTGVEQATVTFAEQKRAIQLAPLQVDDYKHGGPAPWEHQKRVFLLSRDRPAFALFMEQRTGKTKVIIDTAGWLFIHGKIRQALIVAPNSVKTNWVTDELPTHMPEYIPWVAASWTPNPTKTERKALDAVLAPPEGDDRLRWFVMNVEAFSSEKGAEAAARFVKSAPTLMAVDESTRIKTPGARRTRAIIAVGKHAPYRRILTGTPATQGPLDTYTQGKFLDPDILGFGSIYAFRNHFAVMGGWNHKEVVAYAHLDELQRLWDPHSFRVTRDQCWDLPKKGYQKLVVDLTPEQRRVYDGMAQRMMAELSTGGKVTASIVLTQLLRLQQITGGFAALDQTGQMWEQRVTAIPGGNPKITALLELTEDVQGKVVVWARFRAEVAAAAAALREAYGEQSTVEFHGGIDDDGRVQARTAFQDPGSSVRFLVGQTETGGLGINLDQARTLVYLSNSFSLESRLQSEDRASSAQQQYSVAVVDILGRHTIDEKVVEALRSKNDIARLVTGDQWRAWL